MRDVFSPKLLIGFLHEVKKISVYFYVIVRIIMVYTVHYKLYWLRAFIYRFKTQ